MDVTDKFIHFRTQSSYSMLESTIKVNQLVDLAKSHKMSAVCLSDRGNLFALLEFSLAAASKGVQPICGIILNLEVSRDLKKPEFVEILLIAKNKTGYYNLLKLASYVFTKNDRKICNHINFDDLKQHEEGLIALSAYTKGEVGKLLLQGHSEKAFESARKFKSIFGDRFYFEIMRHGLDDEKQIEAEYIEIANKLQIPLIATNQVLFNNASMHDAHDVLLCISEGVVRDKQDRKHISNQCYFKTSEEMISMFLDIPEAIENTLHLSKRCYVMAESAPPSLPTFSEGGQSEEALIRKQATEGLENKLSQKFAQDKIAKSDQEDIRKEYFDRLSYELDIICKMNFSGYFLIVSDFIKWSKENDIAVGPGRGSGAGSIIAWVLLITDLDPIKFGLLFERFLNPERVSMPDFDIDFCQERREEVISYVRSKYGNERVGQIITFGKMQAKAVIKDVSRVLGLQYSIANYITELVPFNAINPVTLSQAIKDVAELKGAYEGKGVYNLQNRMDGGNNSAQPDDGIDNYNDLIKQVLDTSLALEGLHRHSSTHAAGVVIANQDMTQIVPVYKDVNAQMLIAQYSMKYCELAGLVKFDFLGLQTLTVIKKTISLLKDRDIILDIETIPFDDKKTFKMLSNGSSTGVFQFESVGMKNSLKKLLPDSLDDIIALGALYRPGPMDNIPTYIACKHGQQEVDYLHPLLKPILTATYGVIIYQEQVMEIARKLSRYSLASADLLRRAMGKKVKAEMDAQEEMFVNGAIKNKVAPAQAKSIFATVAKFAGYGFNKSHASAYGVISYQTAYLKANFIEEFLVASMNLDIDSSDKINVFLQEAKNSNVEIIPPDINSSQGMFAISKEGDKKSILYAIGAIKNVAINFGLFVAKERSENGEFKSITNFAERIPPKLLNKRLLENIIKAGCFDSLHPNRNSLLHSVARILSYASSFHSEKQSQQFSLISVGANSKNVLVESAELSASDTAYSEFDVFGLFLKNHPLSEVSKSLLKCGVKTSAYLQEDLDPGSYRLKLFGIITNKDARMSQRGRFVTLLLSDPLGIFEITIYNENILKDYDHLINVRSAVVVSCDAFKDNGGFRITANRFSTIEDEIDGVSHNLQLYPKNSNNLHEIVKILNNAKNSAKNNCNITLYLKSQNDFVAKVNLPNNFYLKETDLTKLSPEEELEIK